jgi:prolyl-tRNA synthetase
VEGFAKECAVVTHYRLKAQDGGVVVDPEAKLTEELIIRPTSETIIYDTFSRWVSSWRDLPLLVNQWANIVRWEMRTRPFLRTTEFLWQEGHTAHATKEDADAEVSKMLEVYRVFAEEYLAIPVIKGLKSESEKFAGALYTTTIEAMMQDGKALQAGTSHNLGQHFAEVFDVKFADQDGQLKYCWTTSWGVSTRMMGALIMCHSDDKGLVLPPKIAPVKVVIVPIWKDEGKKEEMLEAARKLAGEMAGAAAAVGATGVVKVDERDYLTVGEKFYEWEKKGVPLRIELGERELAAGEAVVVRRDDGSKQNLQLAEVAEKAPGLLEDIQQALFEKARSFREANIHEISDYAAFQKQMEADIPGFVLAHWCGSAECEEQIKEETKATTRCMPFETEKTAGKCLKCGKATDQRIIFAKAY